MKHIQLFNTQAEKETATIGNPSVNLIKTGMQLEYIPFHHDFVDLGFGDVVWATCNLGAENPEDYGNYYISGKIEPLQPGDTINWNDKTSGYPVTEEWGSPWRCCNSSDVSALEDNTTREVVVINDHRCVKFTSNVNGNYIILPLAGEFSSSSETHTYDLGNSGKYWLGMATGNTGFNVDDTDYMIFTDTVCTHRTTTRLHGYSIRPVKLRES